MSAIHLGDECVCMQMIFRHMYLYCMYVCTMVDIRVFMRGCVFGPLLFLNWRRSVANNWDEDNDKLTRKEKVSLGT